MPHYLHVERDFVITSMIPSLQTIDVSTAADEEAARRKLITGYCILLLHQ